MQKEIWPGGALLAPVPPALVSCGSIEQPAVLTVGWTGIVNTRPPRTYVSIRPERNSYPIIKESGEFVINLPPARLARAVDFCGCRSGRQVDKFALAHLTAVPASAVGAPLIAECPVSLECRVFQSIPLGSHEMFLADILAVQVDAALLDDAGRLCLERADLLAYAHGGYFRLGQQLGSFGYSVRKKKKRRPTRPGGGAPGHKK